MIPAARVASVAAVVFAACVGVILLVLRASGERPVGHAAYAGDAACLSCHAEQSTHLQTAHNLTSRPASPGAVAGSFAEGENVLPTPNPYLHYRMEARADGLFQTAVVGAGADTSTVSGRFDVVVGSGRKGQTYLHWRGGDRLFQLPVSFWKGLGWIHSPGYNEGIVDFDRAVTARCLDCHATFLQWSGGNRYDRTEQILGVSCERCHAPGREHVERQRSTLVRRLASAIVDPADVVDPAELSRERQVELCAQCHGGVGDLKAPAFSYRPGEPLEAYLDLRAPVDPAESLDVHGNQVALLQKSACFQASDMTCSSCHDVHRVQRDAAAFSDSCLGCHQVRSCGLFPERGAALADNCVDCHMPALPARTIVSSHQGRQVQPRVRSHWIRVYAELQDSVAGPGSAEYR